MRNSKSRNSQLLISFFVSAVGIILIQNYNQVHKSFLSSVLSVVLSLVLLLICIIPFTIINRKTNLSFIEFVKIKAPSSYIFISMFYAAYFVYTVVSFLLKYSNVFVNTGGRDDTGVFVALAMLLISVFASSKGIGAVARCSLFVFAFAVISFILFFCGNISNLDFNGFKLDFNCNLLQNNTPVFALILFCAVLFGFSEFSGKVSNKGLAWLICGIGALLLLLVFFMCFSLGNYGSMQISQTFLLSKTAGFGDIGIFDSFHLSLCTMSVFVLLSLCLLCIGKTLNKERNTWCSAGFAAISFLLYITAKYYNSVEEIILNNYVFDVLTLIAAFIIPIIYLISFRRRLNA